MSSSYKASFLAVRPSECQTWTAEHCSPPLQIIQNRAILPSFFHFCHLLCEPPKPLASFWAVATTPPDPIFHFQFLWCCVPQPLYSIPDLHSLNVCSILPKTASSSPRSSKEAPSVSHDDPVSQSHWKPSIFILHSSHSRSATLLHLLHFWPLVMMTLVCRFHWREREDCIDNLLTYREHHPFVDPKAFQASLLVSLDSLPKL